MKLVWHFDSSDIAKVQAFFSTQADTSFVQRRISINLRNNKPPTTMSDFWERMVGCLTGSEWLEHGMKTVNR